MIFLARHFQQCELPLLAVETLKYLVRPQRLVPVDVPLVVGLFVEVFAGVAVENRPAERRARDRVAVAAAGAVPAGQDELELALALDAGVAGVAEERDGAVL